MAKAATALEERPEQQVLPTFEGIAPAGATISFTGTVALDRSAEPIGPEETVYHLVESHPVGINHRKRGSIGWRREQTLEVGRILRVDSAEAIAALGNSDTVIEFSNAHRNDDLGDELSGDGDLPVGAKDAE